MSRLSPGYPKSDSILHDDVHTMLMLSPLSYMCKASYGNLLKLLWIHMDTYFSLQAEASYPKSNQIRSSDAHVLSQFVLCIHTNIWRLDFVPVQPLHIKLQCRRVSLMLFSPSSSRYMYMDSYGDLLKVHVFHATHPKSNCSVDLVKSPEAEVLSQCSLWI